MNETIKSRSNKRIKELAFIKKGDPSLFLVEGYHLVEMAFEASCLEEVLCLSDPHLAGVKTTIVTEEIISKLAFSKSPEPIIGVCRKVDNKDIASDKVLLLDMVQDPGNVGTLLRTALAFSFKRVISIRGSASFYNFKTVSSSQGAIFKLRLEEGLGEEQAASTLKEEGYFLMGSALEGASPFASINVPGKVCLILGNEGQGMSRTLIERSDALAYIPISGIDSLNVGVAGGILMQHVNSAMQK